MQQNENQANKAVSKRRTNEEVKEVLGDEGIKAGQGKKKPAKKAVSKLKEVKEVVVDEGNKTVQDNENPGKKALPKRRTNKKVNEVVGDECIKSGQEKQNPAKKAVSKRRLNKENKTDDNHKPAEERDSEESGTVPEISSLDIDTAPTAQSSPKQPSLSEPEKENCEIERICPCPFECGIEPCEISLMRHHIYLKHPPEQDKNDGDTSTTIEEDNIIRKTFMLASKGLLTSYNYNKLMRDNNFQEVVIPGNGYCYISALLITLAEQGVNKEMAVLAHEVMTEIRNHTRFYRDFENSSSEQEFLTSCADFFQRGSYSIEVVDVCIGATSNALGVNLNVVQKSQKTVTLTRYDCNRYKSSINLFLLYVPPSKKGKNLDGHYNCYVNKDYFKQNKAAINSRIVKPIEENQPQVSAPTSADNVSQSSIETSKT